MLTPDDVRNVVFSKPPLGKRGYNEDQVDELLDRLESTLRGTGGTLTAAQVRAARFGKPPAGKRGYRKQDVDVFLSFAEEYLPGGPAPAQPSTEQTEPAAPKRRRWRR